MVVGQAAPPPAQVNPRLWARGTAWAGSKWSRMKERGAQILAEEPPVLKGYRDALRSYLVNARKDWRPTPQNQADIINAVTVTDAPDGIKLSHTKKEGDEIKQSLLSKLNNARALGTYTDDEKLWLFAALLDNPKNLQPGSALSGAVFDIMEDILKGRNARDAFCILAGLYVNGAVSKNVMVLATLPLGLIAAVDLRNTVRTHFAPLGQQQATAIADDFTQGMFRPDRKDFEAFIKEMFERPDVTVLHDVRQTGNDIRAELLCLPPARANIDAHLALLGGAVSAEAAAAIKEKVDLYFPKIGRAHV